MVIRVRVRVTGGLMTTLPPEFGALSINAFVNITDTEEGTFHVFTGLFSKLESFNFIVQISAIY